MWSKECDVLLWPLGWVLLSGSLYLFKTQWHSCSYRQCVVAPWDQPLKSCGTPHQGTSCCSPPAACLHTVVSRCCTHMHVQRPCAWSA